MDILDGLDRMESQLNYGLLNLPIIQDINDSENKNENKNQNTTTGKTKSKNKVKQDPGVGQIIGHKRKLDDGFSYDGSDQKLSVLASNVATRGDLTIELELPLYSNCNYDYICRICDNSIIDMKVIDVLDSTMIEMRSNRLFPRGRRCRKFYRAISNTWWRNHNPDNCDDGAYTCDARGCEVYNSTQSGEAIGMCVICHHYFCVGLKYLIRQHPDWVCQACLDRKWLDFYDYCKVKPEDFNKNMSNNISIGNKNSINKNDSFESGKRSNNSNKNHNKNINSNNNEHKNIDRINLVNDPKQWHILILLLFKAKTKKTRKNKGVKKRISKKSGTSTKKTSKSDNGKKNVKQKARQKLRGELKKQASIKSQCESHSGSKNSARDSDSYSSSSGESKKKKFSRDTNNKNNKIGKRNRNKIWQMHRRKC